MYFFSCFLQCLMMYGKFQFYAPCIQDQQDSPSYCSSNFCHLQLFYAFSHPVLRKRKGKLLLPRQFFTLCFSYYSDGKLNQYDINRKRNDDTVPPQKKVCNKKRYSVFWQLNLNKTKQKINKSRENLFSVQLQFITGPTYLDPNLSPDFYPIPYIEIRHFTKCDLEFSDIMEIKVGK